MTSGLLTLLLTILTSVLSGRGPEYDRYPLETLCGMYQDKQSISLRSRPAVISLTSRIRKRMRCHLELSVPSESFGFSVFIESMMLDNSTGCSRDFLQFGRDYIIFTSHKSEKKCGTIEPTQRILNDDGTQHTINYGKNKLKEREYIEVVDDDMDIWLEIHPSKPHEATKHLKLIVTPFKKVCSKSDYLYKQCPSNKKCIKRELFCDGIINCDGEEKEEKDEFCTKSSVLPGSGIFMSIPVIIIVTIVSLVVIMGTIVLCKVAREYFKSLLRPEQSPSTGSPPSTTRITNTGEVPPGVPVAPLRNILDHDPRPSAPIMSTGESYPYLSPLPPSYNEVMGIGYKEDPPKYSEFPET